MPVVSRGRITNYRTKQFIQFSLNPSTIKIAQGVNFVEDAIPGFSHPKRRSVSGKSEVVSFTLELDGFMTVDTFGVTFQNDVRPVDPDSPYSIQGEIDYYSAFNLPVDPFLPGATGYADLAVFTFGSLWRGMLCDIACGDAEVLEFDHRLNPTRAKMPIALAKYVTVSERANQRWSYGA